MPNPTAKFETSMGNFEAEIYVEQMPITANNFVRVRERAGIPAETSNWLNAI